MASVFTRIMEGEIPSIMIYEDEQCVVIRDAHPQAPTHVLVIPRKPIEKLSDAQPEDEPLLGHLLLVAGKVARQLGIGEAFRLVINNGRGAGQTVFHLHMHVMGGRAFAEGQMAG